MSASMGSSKPVHLSFYPDLKIFQLNGDIQQTRYDNGGFMLISAGVILSAIFACGKTKFCSSLIYGVSFTTSLNHLTEIIQQFFRERGLKDCSHCASLHLLFSSQPC